MRFDPQANFATEPHDVDPELSGLPVMDTGSPLKMALAIVVIGFVAGGALWIVSEGVPGTQQANAVGASRTGLDESLIRYAESVVAGRKAASQEQPPPAAGPKPVPEVPRRRSRVEFADARAAMGMGQDQKALKHLKKAIRLDPGYADAHYRLGLVYVKLGDNAAARREQATLRSLDVDDLANLLGHLVDN
jgi:tetratricopeptide (TPR) repeat protein